jgi:mono/diheme cytochrome c family protein
MALYSSRLPFLGLIGFLGAFAILLASCESSHDNDRMAAGNPSGRRDPPSQSARVKRGERLFQNVGCMGCHAINGRGGTVGPDLSNEGNAGHSAQWLQTQIRDPKANDPQSIMPAYGTLSDEQINSLVDYLQSLSAKGTQGGQDAAATPSRARPRPTAAPASLVTAGGEQWSRTCGQCHNLRPPSEYDDAQWAVAVDHMRVRVPLTGEQQRSILAFLQASN